MLYDHSDARNDLMINGFPGTELVITTTNSQEPPSFVPDAGAAQF